MKDQRDILGIIPARYGSTRFPGKPLARIKGKPMIQWVYESCSGIFSRLIVATDDQRIMDVVKSFKGESMMTSKNHKSGTERCAEIVEILSLQNYEPDIVVNIQGDEPLIRREQVTSLLEGIDNGNADISTLAARVFYDDLSDDPNLVKVVTDSNNLALYFSRQVIPYFRNEDISKKNFLHHMGLYAYKTAILKEVVKLPSSPLELAESLEQLRWIEHGYKIAVQFTSTGNIGIDTPDDLKKLEKFLEGD